MIQVFCGENIYQKKGLHPVKEFERAIKAVDKGDGQYHSNSCDFVSTVKYYSEIKGVDVEFFLSGESVGSDIEPIFEDFNRAIDLLNSKLRLY